MTIETLNYYSGAYPFKISLKAFNTPSGYLMHNIDNNETSTVIAGKTTGGVSNNHLQILSSGNFSLVVSTEAIQTVEIGYSDFISIANNIKFIDCKASTSNNITNIVTSLTNSQIFTYFVFNIQVYIYGDDNNLFIQPVVVKLSTNDNSLVGDLTLNSANGELMYSAYFISNQTHYITITVEDNFAFSYNWSFPFQILLTNISVSSRILVIII